MTRLTRGFTPLRKLLLAYLSLLGLGWVLLSVPLSRTGSVSVMDNLFMAASALSTTGLTTVNVAETYSWGGELIILLLLQIGGIGFMSVAGYILLESNYGVRTDSEVEERNMVDMDYTVPSGDDYRQFLIRILRYTVVCEVAGSALLGFAFYQNGEEQAIWKGVFTAVSAFCTAGLHLFDHSLFDYRDSLLVNVTVSALSLAGSLGFLFLIDVYQRLRGKRDSIRLTSRVILLVMGVSLGLLLGLLLGYDRYFAGGVTGKVDVMAAVFQVVSTVSTTGFSTVPIDKLSLASQFLMVVFMFIGASPSGTGGGIKNTTAATAIAYVVAVVRRRESLFLLGGKLPPERVHLAIGLLLANLLLVIVGSGALLIYLDRTGFAPVFEVVSALGTVGLSIGDTSAIGGWGKGLLIVLMILGRLGTLSVIMAVLGYSPDSKEKDDDGEREEDIAIET